MNLDTITQISVIIMGLNLTLIAVCTAISWWRDRS